MPSPDARPGPSQVPTWVLRVNEAIDALLLAVRIQLTWLLLTLLGAVVLGIAPATAAAGDAFLAARHGARVRVLPLMWDSWKREFAPANLRMLPLLIVQAGALAMLWIIMGGGVPGSVPALLLSGAAVISAAWSTVSLAILAVVPRTRRQDLIASWRLALLLPAMVPLRFIGLILLLVAWTALCTVAPPLALLFGAAVAVRIAVWLLSLHLAVLLEDLAATARANARARS